jgi:hypothetical protein
MRPTFRLLLPLLGLLGSMALLSQRRARSEPEHAPAHAPESARDLKVLMASVAGEEDPGAAVDSPAPPRPFRGA